MSTHLNWSIEKGGKCPTCSAKTILVLASAGWQIANEKDQRRLDSDGVTVDEEISGHFCTACNSLTSLSLNS